MNFQEGLIEQAVLDVVVVLAGGMKCFSCIHPNLGDESQRLNGEIDFSFK